ncbi:MAG: outer membrane protein assembly factor BamD, partial [Bacteroidaceae bacterium]|nr:outer membrane protein assembly factor BamD [Bacteroidaceae bacterium]
YIGNCTNGGSNYEACIITAENALKTFPYTRLREDLYMLILRCRYQLAQRSVLEKREERYRQTIDEYYGFKNEFPDSKYMKEANQIFKHSASKIQSETTASAN